MDSGGRIYSPAQRREMENELHQVGTAQQRRDEVHRKLQAMVNIPDGMVEQLAALPRARRRAWYSDYRRSIKAARRTGGEVKIPPVPPLRAR